MWYEIAQWVEVLVIQPGQPELVLIPGCRERTDTWKLSSEPPGCTVVLGTCVPLFTWASHNNNNDSNNLIFKLMNIVMPARKTQVKAGDSLCPQLTVLQDLRKKCQKPFHFKRRMSSLYWIKQLNHVRFAQRVKFIIHETWEQSLKGFINPDPSTQMRKTKRLWMSPDDRRKSCWRVLADCLRDVGRGQKSQRPPGYWMFWASVSTSKIWRCLLRGFCE